MKSVNTQLETRQLQPGGCLPAQKTKKLDQGAASASVGMAADRFTRSATTQKLIILQAPAPAQEDWVDSALRFLGPTPLGPVLLGWGKVVPELAKVVTQAVSGVGDFLGGLLGWGKAAEPPAPAEPAPAGAVASNVAKGMRQVSVAAQFQLRAEQEVQLAAREGLGRDLRPEEMADWLNVYNQEGTFALYSGLANSPEGRIARIFQEEVGRPIDDEGRANWLKEHENGESFERIQARLHEVMAIRAGRA